MRFCWKIILLNLSSWDYPDNKKVGMMHVSTQVRKPNIFLYMSYNNDCYICLSIASYVAAGIWIEHGICCSLFSRSLDWELVV